MASTLVRILAPVVVKPETVSKMQSTKFGMAPLTKKGSAPNRETATQERETQRKPSRAPMVLVSTRKKKEERLQRAQRRMPTPRPNTEAASF